MIFSSRFFVYLCYQTILLKPGSDNSMLYYKRFAIYLLRFFFLQFLLEFVVVCQLLLLGYGL